MVKFEERDVFMSSEAQEEIRERMKCDAIMVPQVFVEGQYIGVSNFVFINKPRVPLLNRTPQIVIGSLN